MTECKYCGEEIKYAYELSDECCTCTRRKSQLGRLRKTLRSKKKQSKFYIYIHFNSYGKCLYVGKTKDIKRRQKSHATLSKHWRKVEKIIYAEVYSETQMFVYEVLCINKYQPRYNETYKGRDSLDFLDKIDDLLFKTFDISHASRIKGTLMTLELCNEKN